MSKVYCRDCRYCRCTDQSAGGGSFRCQAPDNMMTVEDWYAPDAMRFSRPPGERNHANNCKSFVKFGQATPGDDR